PGQADRREGGGDRLAEQRLARTHRPFEQQVPAGSQHRQDLEFRLHRAEPGVEEREPPVRHQLGQLVAQPARHAAGSVSRRPQPPAKYISSRAGFGAAPACAGRVAPVSGAGPEAAPPASGAGQPSASTPAGQTTAPAGKSSAAASSAGRQAVTVAPRPLSRAASIAAATPIIASPISNVDSAAPPSGPASTSARRP